MNVSRLVVSVALVQALASPLAGDYSDCSYELDRLRRAASDAQTAADEAASAEEEYVSAADELRQCLSYPEVYDILSDGCRSKRYDAESAESDLESSRSTLEDALDSVRSRAKDVSLSCESDISLQTAPARPGSGSTGTSICPSIKALALRVTSEKLVAFCNDALSLQECMRCF